MALDGEQVASGARHADNVAPALFGGLCLCLPDGRIDRLPAPDWHLTVVHPQVVIKTAEARAVLPKEVLMPDALHQMARLGHFVHCCHTGDAMEAAFALEDVLEALLGSRYPEAKTMQILVYLIANGWVEAKTS